MYELHAKVESLSEVRVSGNSQSDVALNVVIRNLSENGSESTVTKVNNLIRDGLKIRGVSVAKAERKESPHVTKPGVVIASFKNTEEKSKVMKDKKILKDSVMYRDVYLANDQPLAERKMMSNFRTGHELFVRVTVHSVNQAVPGRVPHRTEVGVALVAPTAAGMGVLV
ncbi:hypothetical protein MAR_030425 [Mya arenaria]|uniref:Uncharacterized protein n=1 Tax=Mya arenaria TaxID=6604 RepID=A0ABY7F4V5_MYAAR|nr:hypothetical protein MAR_030425 [Mya arenaria]